MLRGRGRFVKPAVGSPPSPRVRHFRPQWLPWGGWFSGYSQIYRVSSTIQRTAVTESVLCGLTVDEYEPASVAAKEFAALADAVAALIQGGE